MTILTRTEFVLAVRNYVDKTSALPSDKETKALYRNFLSALKEYVAQPLPVLEILRTLKATHIEISTLKDILIDDEDLHHNVVHSCLYRAILHVNTEIEIAMLSIQHPSVCKRVEKVAVSPIFWGDKFTLTDLMEILMSIRESGALVDKYGKPVSMASLVRVTEIAFNVKLKDYRSLRGNVLNRQEVAKCLEMLIKALKDLSEK